MIRSIQFTDLAAQQDRIRPQLDTAIARVLAHGAYIMGPEVAELEKRLAEFCGAAYCVTCSSGTDALSLVLMAKGIHAGDAVFAPSFTFAATAEAVALTGATPVFVDSLPGTFNMDPSSLEQAVATAKGRRLHPAAVIPVDLFGLPADYNSILPIAKTHGLWILCDAAQSFGGIYHGQKVGTLGLATATSFFPAKPLGCYGDGGAIFTDDKALCEMVQSLRVHGKGAEKYDNVRIGLNARLDTLQAAILLEKLAIFPDELKTRQRVADRYAAQLPPTFVVPQTPSGVHSAWAQYTIIADSDRHRTEAQAALKAAGVPTMVYYPKPLHRQTAYKHFLTATGGALPICENLSRRVFSLPLHPYLDDAAIDRIVSCLSDKTTRQKRISRDAAAP
ncbi:MAG: DegT/DnrJ/EryC1/StrS family aminotransferase [Pseudomonadota bacterium]|nr:DegT/DnrJ/EryC1/StrS family aminotransferase [Pseudomonadota bacterium]MDE3038110.1 DegT/DnrJ/EryC1/StrS family aminotransferase [Pseudomonadota bacterium]